MVKLLKDSCPSCLFQLLLGSQLVQPLLLLLVNLVDLELDVLQLLVEVHVEDRPGRVGSNLEIFLKVTCKFPVNYLAAACG